MKDKFIKNGVFSLEYDKETLRDMILELQEENKKLKAELQLYQGALKREHEAIHRVNDLEEVIGKLKEYENNSQLTRSIEGTKIYDGINANYEIKSILKGVDND